MDGNGDPTGNYVLPKGLVIVPPTDHNGELKLNVTAIAQDGSASTLQSSPSSLSFTLLAQSESAEVDTSNISTTEDTVVAISIEPTKAAENGVLRLRLVVYLMVPHLVRIMVGLIRLLLNRVLER